VQDLPFRLLAALLERPGQVVPRAELVERLWGQDTFVDATAGLNTAVAKLRDALGDTADAPIFIETVPKRGYRFIGAVTSAETPPANAAAAPLSVPPASAAAAAAVATPPARRVPLRAAVALGCLAGVVAATWWLTAGPRQHRVAVVLFDNETGLPEWDRRAQGLTDATVAALAKDDALAVIGNAAVLRTSRPFRDLQAIRDALQADFIVVGQVQRVDEVVVVRAHLIRGRDQVHVWFETIAQAATDAEFQADVAGRIHAAVATRARAS
jgi:DNA-binding winged helix-turn-helix (wHTH) protein/TolB-like protein